MSVPAIGRIDQLSVPATTGTPSSTATSGPSFVDSLNKALKTVEDTNQVANAAVGGMVEKRVDVHEAMIALHEAEETLQLTIAIRNKFVQAYQSIMQMGI